MREDQEVRRYPGFSVWLVSKPAKRSRREKYRQVKRWVRTFCTITYVWARSAAGCKPRTSRYPENSQASTGTYRWLGMVDLTVTYDFLLLSYVQRTKPITRAIEAHYKELQRRRDKERKNADKA